MSGGASAAAADVSALAAVESAADHPAETRAASVPQHLVATPPQACQVGTAAFAAASAGVTAASVASAASV